MVIYFYLICIAPIYVYPGIELYYWDLFINYDNYFNNLVEWPTKLYRFDDILTILELEEIYSDDYSLSIFTSGAFFENIIMMYIKKYLIYFFTFVFYFFAAIILFKNILLDYLPSTGILNLSIFYVEFEHNVGNGEDLLMIVSLVFSIILLSLCYIYYSSATIEIHIVLFYLYFVFVIIPIRIVIAMGSNFINYIRGVAGSSKYNSELFSDTMMMTVFLVRFSLQALRLMLIYCFYFLIHEYVFVLPKQYCTNVSKSWSVYGPTLISRIFDFIRWSFELLDSTVSICNQLASFFFVIFWLFSYINTYELKRKKLFWFKSVYFKFEPADENNPCTKWAFKINY